MSRSMSNGGRKRSRNSRVVSIELPPSPLGRAWLQLRRGDVLLRLALCAFAAILMWGVTQAWAPPFVYRTGDVPPTDIVAIEPAPEMALGSMDEETAAEFARHRLLLAKASEPLQTETVAALRLDQLQMASRLPASRKVVRSLVVFGVIFGMFGLCGWYIYHRDRRLLRDLRRFGTLLVLVVVTAATASWFWADPWRAEIIPILFFGMTCGIAYSRELALLLSATLLIFLGLTSGYSLGHFVVLFSSVVTAILLLDQIRSRSKLIKVGFFTGLEVFLLTVGVDILESHTLDRSLLAIAAWNGVWAFLAGFLVTGMLPFIESIFGVLTEISLLELGDASHPLLQELVRRAPGTYNHSINVASIAEAAAESIGAKRLLVRVGAYFHDIGKMLKPGYFVENQGSEANRHDSLVPAMSTLIIIAHVKDGADLARQHHVPEPIIDFIEQHHGTTLVEYFYRRANQQCEAHPEAGSVQESAYRYPGPKPQTREAAVLMLADAVESASRALVEPTPARIESLVEEIAMKRLLDGQFDECGLTLKQLRLVEDSLIKSLTAVYHGRVKYPDQRTA